MGFFPPGKYFKEKKCYAWKCSVLVVCNENSGLSSQQTGQAQATLTVVEHSSPGRGSGVRLPRLSSDPNAANY